jgi:K+-sensing histidine kinase KdpD
MNLEMVEDLLEQYQNILLELDPSGRVTYIGEGWEALTGLKPDETLGAPLVDALLPGDRPWLEEAVGSIVGRKVRERRLKLALVRQEGEPCHVDAQLLGIEGPGGAVMKVAACLSPLAVVVYTTSKAPAAVVGNLQNAETRGRLEAELTESIHRSQRQTARLQVLADTAHQFTEATTHYQGLLDLVARRLAELIGDTATVRLVSEDGQSLQLAANYHPDPEIDQLYRRTLETYPQRLGEGITGEVARTGQPVLMPKVDLEAFLPRTKPEYVPMFRRIGLTAYVVVPLRAAGRVIGTVSLARHGTLERPYTDEDQALLADLADRAALAIENARLISHLEQRIAERTAELQAANRELEAFSYSVSHDLRAPLRAIDAFSLAVMEDYREILPREGMEDLERVRASSARMGQLIDAMLRLGRVTRAEMHREWVGLSRLVGSILAELQRAQPGRRVEVVIREGLTAYGDPQLLKVALENLVGNAWKFTERHPRARIEFGEVERDGQRQFFVGDNGAGFEMAYADKLFSPFQRLHTLEEFPGTGIGLATVKRIIQRHGGSIDAEGKVDGGATFYFTLQQRLETAP